jgi:hypothetical protein
LRCKNKNFFLNLGTKSIKIKKKSARFFRNFPGKLQ